MKKQFFLAIELLVLCGLATFAIQTQDDFFYDDTSFYTTFGSNWLDHTQFQTTRSKATPEDVVSLLIDIGALNLLQANIYKRTNSLNIRSLLDYPSYMPLKYSLARWTFGGTLFYNHTDRDFFTRTSDAISTYLGVCDPYLIAFLSNEVLQEIIQQTLPNFNLDPLEVIPLFKNMTIQERRVGIMFQGMKRFENNSRFRFMFPFYYLESNFWLTPEEQRAIEARFGRNTDQNQFADEHLISDKIGIGDLRLTFDMPLIDKSFFHLRGGFLTTIPLSFAFKQGVRGSKFNAIEQKKPFDLVKLFGDVQGSATEKEQAAQQSLCFFLNALNHLSSNLVEVPLGNGRHFGLGCYIRYKSYLHTFINRRWAENVTFNSFISAELLMPAWHKRFYIETSNQEAFDALGLNQSEEDIKERVENDPKYAADVLSFFETQMTEKFYPFALRTRVWPGLIFRWTSRVHYEGQRWGIQTGFDTWVQSKEHLGAFCIPKTIPQDLDIKRAYRPFAYQWKLFGSIFFKNRHNENDWIFSITGDYTLANTGIGSDYTFALSIERHF